MNKFLHSTYLIGISLFLFGSILGTAKGFDYQALLESVPGIDYVLGLLLIAALVDLGMTGKKRKKPTLTLEKYQFEKFEVEKQLIEKFLTDLIQKDDEKTKVTYTLVEQTISTNISIKKIGEVNVARLVEQLKDSIGKGLEEKFDIKDEFELKFTVEENKTVEEIKEEIKKAKENRAEE
ncbi:alkaline shock response membrane anchor protein AmaP [[Brevibacterium] frigoritolerans]|nr:alkaline shock response membrane anchor protein AmaP [Peribacillus frigoritolerans]